MSLGSTIKYNYLMENTKTLFMNVLSKLPWPTVWSRNDADSIKNFSYHLDKIFISKWVPQQGILGKINVVYNKKKYFRDMRIIKNKTIISEEFLCGSSI